MSQNQPIHILLILLPVVMGVVAACTPHKDTARIVGETAEKIADFDLPDGYEAEFGVHMLGYDLVSYNPGDGASHLFIIQSGFDSDREKLADILADYTPDEDAWSVRMTVVDTREAIVRGHKTTLVFSKGVNSQGEIYAQVMAPFEGKGGLAMLVLSEPVSRWRMETVEAFLASIR